MSTTHTSKSRAIAQAIGIAALVACSPGLYAAEAQFPARPVRLVNPYTPGGSVDLVGRALAAGLSELWGQQVIVDNRPGAGTTIGTELVARAEPDGYTMLINSSAIAIMPTPAFSKWRLSEASTMPPAHGPQQIDFTRQPGLARACAMASLFSASLAMA